MNRFTLFLLPVLWPIPFLSFAQDITSLVQAAEGGCLPSAIMRKYPRKIQPGKMDSSPKPFSRALKKVKPIKTTTNSYHSGNSMIIYNGGSHNSTGKWEDRSSAHR
jgi:hypothetical protein